MRIFNLLTLSLLFLTHGSLGNATTIYGVPAAIQLKFLPLENVNIPKQTSFDSVKRSVAQKWNISPTSIYGYIYNGKIKRNPEEQEWQKDLVDILKNDKDVYLITTPPPL